MAEPDLSLDQYRSMVHQDILAAVQNIYENHDQVTLALSGGIDSLVVLSYVLKLGLLERTGFLCMRNLTQATPLTVHNHHGHRLNLQKLLSRLDRPTRHIDISVEDFAHAFNHGDLDRCKCYCTSAILEKTQDQALVFGWHGNQILLHKAYFYDEMIDRSPSRVTEIQHHIEQSPDCYTQSVHRWPSTQPVPLRYRHLLVKPWMNLDHHNHNRLYAPIGSANSFQALRRLDFDTVPCSVISDAALGRWILHQNVGDFLDGFVLQESIHDIDTLDPFTVPDDLIIPDRIWIPQNLDHDTQGLQYIQEQITQARDTGSWPVNTLMAIKSLQWISEQ